MEAQSSLATHFATQPAADQGRLKRSDRVFACSDNSLGVEIDSLRQCDCCSDPAPASAELVAGVVHEFSTMEHCLVVFTTVLLIPRAGSGGGVAHACLWSASPQGLLENGALFSRPSNADSKQVSYLRICDRQVSKVLSVLALWQTSVTSGRVYSHFGISEDCLFACLPAIVSSKRLN